MAAGRIQIQPVFLARLALALLLAPLLASCGGVKVLEKPKAKLKSYSYLKLWSVTHKTYYATLTPEQRKERDAQVRGIEGAIRSEWAAQSQAFEHGSNGKTLYVLFDMRLMHNGPPAAGGPLTYQVSFYDGRTRLGAILPSGTPSPGNHDDPGLGGAAGQVVKATLKYIGG